MCGGRQICLPLHSVFGEVIMDSIKKPFVKLFHTVDCFYCFDVNTNSIIRISENTYRDIEKLLAGAKVQSPDIDKLWERGYLRANDENIEIKHPALDMVQKYMEGNVRQLIMQVTQNCNLRCKYCVYSGSYINRTHTNKRMNFETAKKAVDFYFQHNTNKDAGVVSFYGGEPLLEMELIKKVVDYCLKLFKGKQIRFNMTTNGTLLTDEIVDYLYKYNFSLTISLDGPQNVHDQSRVFADNHTGTFQKIMENLKRIERTCPDFIKNISFNAVLDTTNDFKCSSNFFTYDFMKDAVVTVTTLNENGNKQAIKYSEAFDINYRYELFKCYLGYIGRLDKDQVSKIVEQQVNSLKTEVHERIKAPYKRKTACHPTGPCIAGAVRFFVTVDGVFYPCERVNEKCDAYVIGNLNDGFDIDKIKKLLNIGELTSEACKNCWAIEYCDSCASGIDEGDKLCPEKKLARCTEIKSGCELKFIEYCTLREMGYQFE